MRRSTIAPTYRLAWTLFVSFLGTACVAETPTLDEEDTAFLVRAENYREFRRINRAPYASALKGTINVYVSDVGAATYDALRPNAPDGRGPVPEGTTIVREVLDESGTVTKLTMMIKGPRGYQPELGDWWFGVTDANLTPIFGEETWEIGRMPSCHGCHIPHAGDDFLFGVPTEMHQ